MDRIRTDVEQLATRFGVTAPGVEAGKVSEWCLDGVEPRFRTQQPPMVTIGPRFDSLSQAEREGALAEAIVSLDLQWAGRYRLLLTVVVMVVVPYAALELVERLDLLPGMTRWHWVGLALITGLTGILVAHCVYGRRTIYHLDRRMTEVLGRELTEMTINLGARSRAAAGGFMRLSTPSAPQRLRRLDSDPASGV
ncbi:hypothetical protein ACIBEH_16340 [Nocardia salmonicida]|uniref:hypothetical protein n=1 Tax=Nocardia salmonicida TaxID=53431 RepID=UPI0033E32442